MHMCERLHASDAWQVAHLLDPRALVPESVMPHYRFLLDNQLETASLPGRLRALRDVGVPYTDDMIQNAAYDAIGQARPDTDAASEVAARYGDATHQSHGDLAEPHRDDYRR